MNLITCDKAIQQVSVDVEKCISELQNVQTKAKYKLNRISKSEYKKKTILRLQTSIAQIRVQIEELMKKKTDLLDLKLKLVRKTSFKPFDWGAKLGRNTQL